MGLRRIRVRPNPDRDAGEVDLEFLFVRREADETFEGQPWEAPAKRWMALVLPSGRFRGITREVGDMERFSMKDFVGTDPPDLDRPSGPRVR